MTKIRKTLFTVNLHSAELLSTRRDFFTKCRKFRIFTYVIIFFEKFVKLSLYSSYAAQNSFQFDDFFSHNPTYKKKIMKLCLHSILFFLTSFVI